jgi:hypothetical protein
MLDEPFVHRSKESRLFEQQRLFHIKTAAAIPNQNSNGHSKSKQQRLFQIKAAATIPNQNSNDYSNSRQQRPL